MSAWARIVAKASPDELADLSAALVEIQMETQRRCVRRLRARADAMVAADNESFEACEVAAEWDRAADLIDPEVTDV
ncbi:hypothetical protein [Streptomyces sp. NPDC020141]|uniref:hypothetical protein n=1 Tax=Streptomyces sp. NPDC020141 TaxID=3365065 RepID=UPI0037AF6388